MVPELWGKPLWEKVWPYLDPWDSARLRTASTHWNVPGKYGPHGELFFFLKKKEQVVTSNEVLPNPLVSTETLKGVCTDRSAPCWRQTTKWDQAVASLLTKDVWKYMGVQKKPDLEQPVFGKCHLW